jgi:putative phosphoesterase
MTPYSSPVPRLALISDLHGNLLAFEAVLGELEEAGVEGIVCLGDVAAGPQPRETVARLRCLNCPVVLGNWDTWMLDGMPDLPGYAGPRLRDQGEWSAAQLDEGDRQYLATLPERVELQLDGASVLCVHGSPRSFMEQIHPETPDHELSEMLGEAHHSALTAGHTHVQLVRPHNSTLIVNPGSVGLPFHSWRPNGAIRLSPWAEYAILTAGNGHISAELRRAPYDIGALRDVAHESGMPHRDWWTGQWLSHAEA